MIPQTDMLFSQLVHSNAICLSNLAQRSQILTPVLTTDKLTRSLKHGAMATGATDITFAARHDQRPDTIAVLTNQLLRDLGYSPNLNDLRALFA